MRLDVNIQRVTSLFVFDRMFIECVPNISEGKNLQKIELIVEAARQIHGCVVLGVEPDEDYNRTVITLAGTPDNVYLGVRALVLKAIEEIDMSTHKGEHPRLGAVDVCPFVPLSEDMMPVCVDLAEKLAKEINERTGVGTYLYGFAAKSESKRMLSDIRKGQYEGLEDRFGPNSLQVPEEIASPDFGGKVWNDIAKNLAV